MLLKNETSSPIKLAIRSVEEDLVVSSNIVSSVASGGVSTTGSEIGGRAGITITLVLSEFVSDEVSESVATRSLGLTTATESARVTGPIKGILGSGIETVPEEQVIASGSKAGIISTAESSTAVKKVALGLVISIFTPGSKIKSSEVIPSPVSTSVVMLPSPASTSVVMLPSPEV